MSLLPILVAPDPLLKQKAAPVAEVDAGIRRLMDDMLETMYDAPGIGLAAPQIGRLLRVIVVDVTGSDEPRRPLRMANPELIDLSEDDASYNEGCLSLPDHYADVVRPASVTVRYRDEENRQQHLTADGLLAVCIQHELDHLEGILFVDHVSAIKRNMILRKLVKLKKQRAQTVA